MAKRIILKSVLLGILVGLSGLLTFRMVSKQTQSANLAQPDRVITLTLPDQTYVVTRETLARQEEIVIPVVQEIAPTINYNVQTGLIEPVDSPIDYVVKTSSIVEGVEGRGENREISLTPSYTLRPRYSSLVEEYNHRLSQVYRSPLNIRLKNGVDYAELTLPPKVIRKILMPQVVDLSRAVEVSAPRLIAYVESQLSPKQKEYFNPEATYLNTRRAINARFLGEPSPIVLGIDDGPSSDGTLAEKYLEVDLSQQKMYFFINKSLHKEYRISTGVDYPTPTGEFYILNKAPKAFSEIYNVWMPYWMAFTYANKVEAYLGIHEIAYAIDEKGKPFYKYGYYIGDKKTGGCIAMEPKDAPEVYNLADVGMLVRIVE